MFLLEAIAFCTCRRDRSADDTGRWSACVRHTDCSVVRVNGNEKPLNRSGTIAYGQPADLREKAVPPEQDVPLHLEINLQRAAAKLPGALAY